MCGCFFMSKKGNTTMFQDAGQTLDDFADHMYVRCPQCQQCAHVLRIPAEKDNPLLSGCSESFKRIFDPRKLSCLHCGYTKSWEGIGVYQGRPYDWYFGLPLWLQTPCCGEILWALNKEHLGLLERFVTAKQRIRFHVPGQVRNGTIASRLPRWMKSAKNRNEVIKGIMRLRVLLEGP